MDFWDFDGCFVSVINSSRILLVAPERLMGQHFVCGFCFLLLMMGILSCCNVCKDLLPFCDLQPAVNSVGEEIKMSCLTFHSYLTVITCKISVNNTASVLT